MWRAPREVAVTSYVRELYPHARKRHYHETRRGVVVDFVVQLEVLFRGRWVPIVRYDMAHGTPHVDRYETPTTRTKTQLDMTPAEALTLADADVNEHWLSYRQTFPEGNRP